MVCEKKLKKERWCGRAKFGKGGEGLKTAGNRESIRDRRKEIKAIQNRHILLSGGEGEN